METECGAHLVRPARCSDDDGVDKNIVLVSHAKVAALFKENKHGEKVETKVTEQVLEIVAASEQVEIQAFSFEEKSPEYKDKHGDEVVD